MRIATRVAPDFRWRSTEMRTRMQRTLVRVYLACSGGDGGKANMRQGAHAHARSRHRAVLPFACGADDAANKRRRDGEQLHAVLALECVCVFHCNRTAPRSEFNNV